MYEHGGFMELKYIVLNEKYETIRQVLKSHFGISDRLLTKLKKNKKIYVNNNITYADYKLKIGDSILVDLNFNEVSENIIPKKIDLDILYEDEAFVIINKSSNIPVHPSILHFEDNLSNGVMYYFQKNNIKTKIR